MISMQIQRHCKIRRLTGMRLIQMIPTMVDTAVVFQAASAPNEDKNMDSSDYASRCKFLDVKVENNYQVLINDLLEAVTSFSHM